MTTGNQVVVRETGEIIESSPVPIKLSTQAIAIIAENIQLAQKLVTEVLEPDIDYGSVPGLRGEFLWDPGTSKILAAFNCFPRHKILEHTDTDEIISWTIEVDIVSRDTQQVVAAGMGAASTRETKYGKRWTKDPTGAGFTEEESNQLRRKEFDPGVVSYQIPNPDIGDLNHTLLVMASKRAESDAAKSLPGVGSALRRLFDGKQGKKSAPPTQSAPPDYPHFWTTVKAWGLNEAQAHYLLKVKSMKEWVDSGKSLNDALIELGRIMFEAAAKAKKEPVIATQTTMPKTPGEVKKTDVKTLDYFEALAAHFWNLEPEAVYMELGFSGRQNFTEAAVMSASEAFEALRTNRSQ